MRRPLLLVALFFIACSAPPDETPPPGSGNGGGDNTPASAVQGSLTVHTRLRLDSDPDFGLRSVHVLLGDGSRFKQAIDANGDVRFTDPAITGPQSVTVVRVSNSGSVAVQTFLGIEKPEVWTQAHISMGVVRFVEQGTLQGRVTGGSGGTVRLAAFGPGLSGGTQAAADGTYSLEVWGPEAGVVDVLAYEEDASGLSVTRVGIKRGISTSTRQTQGGQDLVLSQAVDQPYSVTVSGLAPYGGTVSGTLHHAMGGGNLFDTYASGASPLAIPGLPRTAPFDVLSTRMTLTVGRDTRLPNGETRLEKALGTGSSESVTLLGPVNITAPTVGTSSSPGTVSRANFRLAWTVDPATQVGGVFVATVDAPKSFSWHVQGPPTLTTFSFFPLPSDVAPLTAFPAGRLRLDAGAFSRANFDGYLGHFVENLPLDHAAEYRVSEVRGFVRLE
jgi:hypothetical protein